MSQDTEQSKSASWVLIVEDDVSLNKAYKAKFTHEGIEAELAVDGDQALKTLARPDLPALILLDLMMPKKNGFDVLKEIKRDPRLRRIPIIVLTNLGQEADAKRGIALGADEYLIKSDTKIEDVVLRVRNYIP